MHCADETQGEFEIQLTEIEQGILDVLTQGFALKTVRAKIKWRKKGGNKCVYKIVISGKKGDTELSKDSEEFEIQPCPA
jgi:hypothetical protein